MKPWGNKGGGLGALNDCTWAEIQQAAQTGKASKYWSVGDRKAVVLNGTVGSKTFSNQTVYAYILGFNHNATLEGNNTIHFQFGFDALTGGNPIAFIDSYYGNSSAISDPAFYMNNSYTNSGGWNGSFMRNTIIPAFINAMPSDLQAVLKAVNKYTDNGAGVSPTSSEDVTATSDKVFLLSEYEIFGVRKYASIYEQNSQAQYDYYISGNSPQKYQDTSTTNGAHWRVRSKGSNNRFALVYRDGTDYLGYAIQSYGFAPGFVVG